LKRKAYVTGADRGLGLGFVQTLLEQDYQVYAGSFMPEWNELKKMKDRYPEDLVILSLDVSEDESVRNAAEIIKRDTDYLNVIINNAGSAHDRSSTLFDEQYFDDIRKLFEINTFGPLRVTQSVLSLLLKGTQKTLINISSLAGSIELLTRKNQIGYTMSKAALNMQSKSIHNNLKEYGVKVLAIHPGWMRSHIFGDIEKMKDAPLEPIDSARVIVDLISTKTEINEDLFMDYQGNPIKW
jgi:NAD(P)-dependent dehydrogenase (short-subunit alcohol dehydrogenase family)